MKMSDHFDLEEFTVSQTAIRNNIDNMPTAEALFYIQQLCTKILEPLVHAGLKFSINSGYRSPELNKKIGGAKNSQHCTGQAADLHPIGMTVEELYQNIARLNVPFDQLIQEYNSWVHVSYSVKPRSQKLRASKDNKKTIYTPDNNTY